MIAGVATKHPNFNWQQVGQIYDKNVRVLSY